MIQAYAKSDKGKIREDNQDYYYISEQLNDIQLFLLADRNGWI